MGEQSRGYAGRTARYQYAIERGELGQPLVPIAINQRGAMAHCFQPLASGYMQGPMTFYGEDLGTEQAEYGRLVSASCADLQNLRSRNHLQELALESNSVRLRDGLAVTDRERCILVCEPFKGRVVDEGLSWKRTDRVQHTLIGDTDP